MTLRTAPVSSDGSALVRRISETSRRPKTLGGTQSDAISLAMGEPFAGTSDRIVEAATTALSSGRTRYEALTGAPTLKTAISEHLLEREGLVVTTDHVVPTHGASAGLAAVVLATVNPGDRVVIPEPTYSLYADHVAMAGGSVEWVASRQDGTLDLDAISLALDGAAMLILCSPGNPTGGVVDEPTVRALADVTRNAGALFVSDEAYSDIVFDGRTFFSALAVDDNEHVVCCRTFSKSYAMTGWRLGYVVAEPRLAASINLVHRTFNGALSTFVQDAGVAALGTPATELAAMTAEYEARRDIVTEALAGLDGVRFEKPAGGFYAWVRVRMDITSDELVRRFADGGVLVRSGPEYGPSGEGAFRISFATAVEDLREGLRRIALILAEVVR